MTTLGTVHITTLGNVDLIVLVVYVLGVVGFGAWFVRKSSRTDEFMAAGRSLPGWAVGLSIFGTYVSSISFLALPAATAKENWNRFVFSLSLPIAAAIAVSFFVPFYRRSGEISAYTHLEHRFGLWARTYAVICYLLVQLVRMGAIMLLVALALEPLTGWPIQTIIIVTGVLVTLYTLLGGIEAVIWTDVVQSIVLTGGALVTAVILITGMPEGPGQIFTIAAEHLDEAGHNKFSLGSFGTGLVEPTFWVVIIYGLTDNLRNFGIDQSYVQRYITAKSDGDAARSVWMGALCYIPISALLCFIGTALFAYYTAQPELLPDSFDLESNSARLFPHFIVNGLPTGMTGLLIAAIFAAAMSSVDSSLNSSATLLLQDVYKRYFRPAAGERESMAVLYTTTLVWGALGTGIGLALVGVDSILDAWWKLSGILSGGMLGLFLLGYLSKRAGNPAALTGVLLGLLVISWMTLSQLNEDIIAPFAEMAPGVYATLSNFVTSFEPYRTPLNGLLTIVVGTLTILLVGLLVSRFSSGRGARETVNEEGTG